MKNITKYDFSLLCDRIETIIYKYFDQGISYGNYGKDFENIETYDLEKRKITFFLSNGDSFNYSINRNNLAHLLGINTDYLVSCGLFDKSLTSFRILEKIVTNPDSLYKKHEQGIINIKKFVSPYIERKLDAFEKNAFTNFNDIYLVCKYDRSRSYGFNSDLDSCYMVIQESGGKFYLYIISKNDKGAYVPVSNQLYESYDELYNNLSSKIINQELVIVTGLNTLYNYSESKKEWLSQRKREEKLNILDEQSKNFQCIPNVLNAYLYLQKTVDQKKVKENLNDDYLLTIISAMSQRKPIDTQAFDLESNSKILGIINAYNDSLFAKPTEESNVTFSELQAKNISLKSKLEETLRQYEELKEKHEELEKKYSDQEKNLEELEHKIQEVRKVLG